MGDVERSDGSNQVVPWRPPLSLILVSVLAAVAAIIHVAFPSLTIDAVTLGLLAVAALPWLAPVVKSLKFGSLEVDLRDLQQNLHEVRNRVEESAQKVEDLSDQVQRIVFSGAVDAGTRTELETAMSDFFAYLRQVGLPLPSTEPHVEVVDSRGPANPVYYSARIGKILVARKLTGDLGRVLSAYGDYLCSSVIELPDERRSPQLRAVSSGLGVYFSSSYRGNPEVAKETYDMYRREAASDDRRRNLETRERRVNLDSNNLRIRKLSAEPGAKGHSQIQDGLAWGGTLWRVRTVLGAETADRLLIESWKRITKEPVLAASAGFASTLVELIEQQNGTAAAKQVQEVFHKRGWSQWVVASPPH